MTAIIFDPAARVEMLEALDWYVVQDARSAERFIVEVERAVSQLAANPLQYPKIYRDVRRIRLRRFPYGLFFQVEDSTIRIIACFHASRDPYQWQRRG